MLSGETAVNKSEKLGIKVYILIQLRGYVKTNFLRDVLMTSYKIENAVSEKMTLKSLLRASNALSVHPAFLLDDSISSDDFIDWEVSSNLKVNCSVVKFKHEMFESSEHATEVVGSPYAMNEKMTVGLLMDIANSEPCIAGKQLTQTEFMMEVFKC